jgi:hypothetical protein
VDAALGNGNVHDVAVDTSSAGNKAGTISVGSASQQVQGGSYSASVGFTVLDHSNASFSTVSDQDTKSLDLGTFQFGQGVVRVTLADLLGNVASPSGFTAALDLDLIEGVAGDLDALSLDGLFVGLSAGEAADLTVAIDTGVPGTLLASYQLGLSDADLPGANLFGTERLSIALSATVVPEPAAGTLVMMAVGVALRRRRQRSV